MSAQGQPLGFIFSRLEHHENSVLPGFPFAAGGMLIQSAVAPVFLRSPSLSSFGRFPSGIFPCGRAASTVQVLAKMLREKGDIAAAEQLYRTRILRLLISETEAQTFKELGKLLIEKNLFDEAELLHRERLAIYQAQIDGEAGDKTDTKKKLATVHHDLGHLFEKSGDMTRSAESYAAGLEIDRRVLDKKDIGILRRSFCLMRAQFELSDRIPYRQTCRRTLEDFPEVKDDNLANTLASYCVRLPDTVADRGTLVALAKHGPDQESENRSSLHTSAFALYRADQYSEAREQLNESIRTDGQEAEAFDHVLNAMLRPQEGDAVGAKLSLEKVAEVIQASEDDSVNENESKISGSNLIELKLLYEEAKSLIDPTSNDEATTEERPEQSEPSVVP